MHAFPEWENRVRAAFTTRYASSLPESGPQGKSSGAYADLNLGFSCGDEPAKVSGNWLTVLTASGLAGKTLVIPRMVHGDAMVDVDGLADPPEPSEKEALGTPATLARLNPADADALYTRSAQRVLAVTMADCLTALVFDPVSRTAAAIHAGWRGTRARILEKALRTLADSGRIRPEKTLVALGPCLRPESLEVGAEVAASLDPAFVTRQGNRFFFDMPGSNRAQAIDAGIAAENIRDLGGCTLLEPDRFFSYRRDGQASGRLAAFISLL
ncbi:MAG: polyphenol oxidase family protein [Fibrobacterota bacterium]|nr:polyphenol oxidase family protein [Fibrobacterota bacterium]